MGTNGEEIETKWTDDRVRWHEDFEKGDKAVDATSDDDDAEEEEECAYMDPFKDPDPFETFSFQFEVVNDEAENRVVDIELRGYKTEADAVWKSTGLTLWKASEHLCKYLAKHPNLIAGKRVLELGAGLGLCGILAHCIGGKKVCITDGDTDALVHLRENLKKNMHNDNTSVTGHQLIWGKSSSSIFQERHGTFEVLLASDIIYARCIVEPLWETVRILLSTSSPESKFIMAYYTGRKVDVTIEYVLEKADEAGLSYKLEQEDEGVRVFTIQWKREHL